MPHGWRRPLSSGSRAFSDAPSWSMATAPSMPPALRYCRTWHSFDVAKCEASYNHPEAPVTPPAYKPLLVMALYVESGVEEGLFHSGLDPHTVDLVPALWLAFNVPDAGARWLAGEDVFEPAWLLDSDQSS